MDGGWKTEVVPDFGQPAKACFKGLAGPFLFSPDRSARCTIPGRSAALSSGMQLSAPTKAGSTA